MAGHWDLGERWTKHDLDRELQGEEMEREQEVVDTTGYRGWATPPELCRRVS